MTSLTQPVDGCCRCGKVRIRISAAPIMTMACHCTGCQKMTASAYSLTVAIPSAGFNVVTGEPVIGGLHGEVSRHHHCDWCKSWIFTRVPDTMGFVNVRPTMLEGARWSTPFIETYKCEALPWATTPAVHSYDKSPTMEEFGPLAAEFEATWGKTLARP